MFTNMKLLSKISLFFIEPFIYFFMFAKTTWSWNDSINYLMVWSVICHFLINYTETNCVIKGWNMVPKPNLSLCLIWKEAELFTITRILVLKPPERAFISYFLPFRHLQDKRGPGSTGIISPFSLIFLELRT